MARSVILQIPAPAYAGMTFLRWDDGVTADSSFSRKRESILAG